MTRDKSLQLRRAVGADARAVAEVHVASWQFAYRGILPSEFLDELDVKRRAILYSFDSTRPEDPVTWIAVDRDVVGFVTTSGCRDADANGSGEIQALYVAPSRWRCGVGRELLNKGEHLLAEMEFAEASLWVLEANDRARLFYEARGWEPDGAIKTLSFTGVDVAEVRYRKALT